MKPRRPAHRNRPIHHKRQAALALVAGLAILAGPDPAKGQDPAAPFPGALPSAAAAPDTAASDSASEEPIRVRVWPAPRNPGAHSVADDSLLRWRPQRYLLPLLQTQSGLRLYSTGSPLRPTAVQDMTRGPASLQLRIDGLDRTDPLTGLPAVHLPSPRIIAALSRSAIHGAGRWEGVTRDLYLNRPRLYLYFNEAGDAVRDLDVQYALNVRKDLNVELGYHDLRDALAYSGSRGEAGVVRAKAWYQPDPRWLIRAGLHSRTTELDEPFGYTQQPLAAFTFNPLIERPQTVGVRSTRTTRDLFLQAMHDPGEDGSKLFWAGLHQQSARRRLPSPTDSIDAGFERLGGFIRHDRTFSSLRASAEARLDWDRLQGRSLPAPGSQAIAAVRLQADLHWTPAPRLAAAAHMALTRRSDHPSAPLAALSIRHGDPFGNGLSLELGTGRRPVPYQPLHWRSLSAQGNPDLRPETVRWGGLRGWIRLWDTLQLHAEAEAARTASTPWLTAAGPFAASGAYRTLAFSGGARLRLDWLEAAARAETHIHALQEPDLYTARLDASGSRLRVFGSVHVKTPVFDRAAFVRAGLSTRLAPLAEVAPSYDPLLDRWDPLGDTRLIPPHAVLDGDASVRLRWMMLYLRWENLLDRLTQPGYFETPGYPMPGRRFHFGISVLFKN